MTSSNGNIFRITGPSCGNSPVIGEFPAQRPVTRRFDVFFDLRLNKRLSKQSWGWWSATPLGSLWRHCNTVYIDRLSKYMDSYYTDETVVRPSYLYNGNPYTGKMTSLHWDCTRGSILLWLRMVLANDNRLNIINIFSHWLTHWGRDKMAAFSQATISNAFSWMKILEFRLKIHWSLFLRVLLTIFKHWFW